MMAVIGLAGVALLLGCTGGQQTRSYTLATGGSVHSGRRVIANYKCGSCHTIPGIAGAHGVFGPPLNMMARRTYIAGNFANNPDNLTHWVMAPTSMKPKTAMPDLGLTLQQARDVTAYLETLR
jgi:cytochrome c